jgi:heme-degrading monooxygenase HmoA
MRATGQKGESTVILRIWRGLVPIDKAAEYADLVRRTGIAGYREAPGNLDAQVALRDLGDGRSEVLTLSWWTDLDDIRAFAGADAEVARHYPEDDAFLLDRNERARHYEATR